MIAKMFDIKETQSKGRGLFAREFILKGTIICFECNNCKALSEEGKFVVGKTCVARNCGECRILSDLHPFSKKRIVDLLFNDMRVLAS